MKEKKVKPIKIKTRIKNKIKNKNEDKSIITPYI